MFARGINFYATQNLFLPEDYIAKMQSDIFTEWTYLDVIAVLINQEKNLLMWKDSSLLRIDLLLNDHNLSPYGSEPLAPQKVAPGNAKQEEKPKLFKDYRAKREEEKRQREAEEKAKKEERAAEIRMEA